MTLDEAIKRAEDVAEQKFNDVVNIMDKAKSKTVLDNAEKCKRCAEEHRQLAEWLKELKQLREQARWIPVSERLPEQYKEVIVTDIETSDTYLSRYIGNGYWECDNGLFMNKIIAWMPLPVYKESPTSEDSVCDTCYHNETEFSICQYCTGGDKYEELYKAESEEENGKKEVQKPEV